LTLLPIPAQQHFSKDFVDTQTRHALKQDRYIQATATSIGWMETHRKDVIRITIVVVIVLAAVIGATAFYIERSNVAQVAFGQAVEIYTSPLRQADTPPDATTGTYLTSAERAKAANSQFLDVANRYGWTEAGKNARYFAGLTYIDMGQTSAAESTLKQVAGSHNSNIAALAKSALAGLYHQTGRDDEAIQIYQGLIAQPTLTVPAASAQLQLAELYEPTRPEEARKLYAEIEDKDKTTAAGQIAAQKLKGPGK
jgi:tetratricopeptide (TPR) repeat protein